MAAITYTVLLVLVVLAVAWLAGLGAYRVFRGRG
jgi:hypothetical protein